MVIRNVESYALPQGGFEVGRGMPPQDVLEERLRFVKDMRWLPEDLVDDTDRYDTDVNTLHFTRRDSSGSVITSMRLTPVECVEKSLSYEMMNANKDLQLRALGNSKFDGTDRILDLTRLTFPLHGRHDERAVHDAAIVLFGAAARLSIGSIDGAEGDVHWIYSTTSWGVHFFKKSGIKNEIIAEGKLPDVDGRLNTTFFCTVNVASAIEALKTSNKFQDTYKLLCQGVAEAELRLGAMHA